MRGATVEVKCACGTSFTARVADRKRGWAKSCSKSCAAIKSNRETGKYEKHLASVGSDNDSPYGHFEDTGDNGWDAHKDYRFL